MVLTQQTTLGLYEVQIFNTTQLSSTDSKPTFSHANVFALYLTLSFCLLVQPYGSLLYPKPRSILGRVLFFFWRLNPISGTLEVALLAVVLANGILIALKDWRAPPEQSVGFWKQLQITATAAQLLRTHGLLPEHLKVLADGVERSTTTQPALSASDLREPNSVFTNPVHNPNPSRHDNNYTQTVTSIASEPSISDTVYSDSPSPASNLDVSGVQTAASNISPPTTPNPPQVEASSSQNEQSEVEAGRPTSRFPSITRGGRSHADIVIDLVSSGAVLIMLIRLFAVVIPLYLRIPACFMVASWAAIQILNLASHRRDVDLADPAYLIRRAIDLEAQLKHVVTWSILSIMLFSVFIYCTFVLLFRSRPLPPAMQITGYSLIALYLVLGNPWLSMIFPRNFSLCCLGNRRDNRCAEATLRCASQLCSQPTSITLIVVVFLVICCPVGLVYGYFLGMSMFACVFEENVMWWYMVLPFSTVPLMMWAWSFLPALPLPSFEKSFGWVQGVGLFYNLVFTGLYFIAALMIYDDKDTYKPEWLDWLGRLGRLKREMYGV